MDELFLWFIVAGFFAQLVDGALGMAYGVISASLLLSLGMPPAIATANVHAAKLFTAAASGGSHWLAGNVSRDQLWRLSLGGAVGGVVGALVISHAHHAELGLIRTLVAVYLFLMGVVVILKALGRAVGKPSDAQSARRRSLVGLGLAGGVCDAVGGGGWGPVVTTTMVARGENPVKSVGTVNLAEFFMSAATSAAFLATLGPTFGKAALGLVIGGLVAAPIAAFGARYVPRKMLTGVIGVLICLVSLWNLSSALGWR